MLVIVLIILSGGLGGVVFALASPNSYKITLPFWGKEVDTGFLGHMVIGIAGAIVTVAFIELLGLDVTTIEESINGEKIKWTQTLHLLGVGVIGGFSGLKLISGLSNKILKDIQQEVSEVKQKTIKDEATMQRLMCEMLLVGAREKIEENRYTEALTDAEKAIQMDEGPKGWGAKARALRWLGRYDEAILALDKAIELAYTLNRLGVAATLYWNRACYKALISKDIQSIIGDLDESIKLMPTFKEGILQETDLEAVINNKVFREHYEL